MLYLTNKRRFGLRSGAARIEEIERAIVKYFVSRDEDNRRVLPRVVMPAYRVPPAPQPRRFRSPHYSRERYGPAIPILNPITARRSRRAGLYQPRPY